MKELSKDSNFKQLYADICHVLSTARGKAYSAVNFAMVQSYWQIGKLITDEELGGKQRADYGRYLMKELSERLTRDFGKGFDERELRKICQFYRCFPIRDTLRPELSWSHYRRLISVENADARIWYMNEAAASMWSTRQLDRQISTLYYDRLLASADREIVKQEAAEKLQPYAPESYIKDPYFLEFIGLDEYPALRESTLEIALIDNLQHFLLELGRGFCFVARQKRMRYEDEDFYIDLVFYHSILKCHVLIDLKIGKLTHQDIVDADLRLVSWLADTFAGRNKHFATAEGWNPTGLAEYLREGLDENIRTALGGKLPEDDYGMIDLGARLFLNNAYVMLEQIGTTGSLSGLEQHDGVLSFVNYWSCLLTGCPMQDE